MAGISLSPLLNTITHITSLVEDTKSLKSFLQKVDSYGILVTNNFEVNFSGLPSVEFFISNITMPGLNQTFTELNYNGRSTFVPVVYDFDHTFNMTFINDASGVIYSALVNFLMSEASNTLANSGYTMIIKQLSGDDKYSGLQITLNGVIFEKVSGLTFGYSDANISTFEVTLRCIDFNVSTGGTMGTIGNIVGAATSLFG